MSNFADKGKREERRIQYRSTWGKYFLDISKLTFGAIVLQEVLTYEKDGEVNWAILLFGISMVVVFALIGKEYIKN